MEISMNMCTAVRTRTSQPKPLRRRRQPTGWELVSSLYVHEHDKLPCVASRALRLLLALRP